MVRESFCTFQKDGYFKLLLRGASAIRRPHMVILILFSLFTLLTACGTYDASVNQADKPHEDEYTNVTFSLSLGDNSSSSTSLSGNDLSSPPLLSEEMTTVKSIPRALYKIDCASTSIYNIVITVYDSSNTELVKKTFSCSAHSGTIQVPSGNNRRFVLSGQNASGQELYRGERNGINL